MKKILYIDMDEIPNIFSMIEPLVGAIKAYQILSNKFDTYILSTAPWNTPTAWSDKLVRVQKYLGDYTHKRLIISHNKHLNRGDFLIDDRLKNGVDKFQGEHIHFGQGKFRTWDNVLEHLDA